MKTRLTLFCALLLVCSGFAAAQDLEFYSGGPLLATPDGIPPSVEDVCDGQIGAAFGLCNAYCEAMDCDSDAPQASQKACDRVAANFEKQTGTAPPCSCPCVGRVDGFIEALNGEYGLQQCVVATVPGVLEYVALFTVNPILGPGAQSSVIPNLNVCGFGFGTGELLEITFQEAEQCKNLVRQKAEEAGLECVPI